MVVSNLNNKRNLWTKAQVAKRAGSETDFKFMPTTNLHSGGTHQSPLLTTLQCTVTEKVRF